MISLKSYLLDGTLKIKETSSFVQFKVVIIVDNNR